MRNNYAASTYAKPGPLPIIPLPFHFGQDHCLKVRQEFLHHKVAQDLYGQKIKMTCSHIVLPLETEHLHDRMMCKCRQPLIYNGFTNIQWLHKHTMASPSQLPGGLHFKYQVCLRETQCISSEAFSTASLWETTQPLTTEELRCWTKMPIQFFCTLLWNCHVKTNGVKIFISIEYLAQKHLKSWFADCSFPKLTLFWDIRTLPEEVSSRRNCLESHQTKDASNRKIIGQKEKRMTGPMWISGTFSSEHQLHNSNKKRRKSQEWQDIGQKLNWETWVICASNNSSLISFFSKMCNMTQKIH